MIIQNHKKCFLNKKKNLGIIQFLIEQCDTLENKLIELDLLESPNICEEAIEVLEKLQITIKQEIEEL